MMPMKSKKWMTVVCAGILLAGLAFGVAGTADVAQASHRSVGVLREESNEDKLADAKKDAADIKANRKTAQQRLDGLKADKADLEAYIRELDENMLEIQDAMETLGLAMEGKQLEIDEVQKQLEGFRRTQQAQYDAMKLRIQFMYENGNTQYLEMLFQTRTLFDFLKKAEYIGQMMRYDRQMLSTYQKTCQDVLDTEQALLTEFAEMEELQAVNEASLQDMEALMEVKNEELNSFTTEINNAQKEVNAYTSSLKAQEDLIKEIEDAIRKEEEQERVDANAGDIGVKFIWPIPDSSRITSKFGPRKAPVAGASNYHKGVDVGAPRGTPIYAAAGGTVVISTYHYSAGNYVMINHGGGVYTVYMHASKLLVEVGDKVKQGEKIALVGTTGYSTGNHLHFGVRINGTYYNPLDYVVVP